MADIDLEHLRAHQARLHHISEHVANERTILALIRTAQIESALTYVRAGKTPP